MASKTRVVVDNIESDNIDAHNIVLGDTETVDGVDVSLQKTNMDHLIRQMHPNVSMLAAMDEATMNSIAKVGDNYVFGSVGAAIDSYSESNVDSYYGLDARKYGQAFSMGGVNKILSAAKFYLKKTLTPSGNMTARLYACTGTVGTDAKGTGAALATSDPIGVATLSTSPALITFIFSTPYTLQANTDYVIAISNDGGESTLNVGYDGSSPTHSGNACSWFADSWTDSGANDCCFYIYTLPLTGNIKTGAIAANSAVLSFFSYLKGKFSNGDSTHALPVGVEIYGNGDSYASALNATTKFKIAVADPRIELYRIDDSEVAKSNDQTDWVLDDNVTNGAFPTKTTSTHETILAEEIGCASVVMVEKSVDGAFTDTEILVEDDDYTVDYSTRTATKIILTSAEAADIVISQSKLRITWIADIENIDGTANTALKMKIYLNRTNTGEASPEIQKIDIGTDKYAEMKYMCG